MRVNATSDLSLHRVVSRLSANEVAGRRLPPFLRQSPQWPPTFFHGRPKRLLSPAVFLRPLSEALSDAEVLAPAAQARNIAE